MPKLLVVAAALLLVPLTASAQPDGSADPDSADPYGPDPSGADYSAAPPHMPPHHVAPHHAAPHPSAGPHGCGDSESCANPYGADQGASPCGVYGSSTHRRRGFLAVGLAKSRLSLDDEGHGSQKSLLVRATG